MLPVVDEATLQPALSAPRAILVLHAEWSMPSVIVLRSVQQWEADLRRRPASSDIALFFAVTGDAYPAPVVAWLKTTGMERFASTGWGEVFWLEHGRVIAQTYGHANASPSELTRRTAELWGPDPEQT
jgi:hypothetical protein